MLLDALFLVSAFSAFSALSLASWILLLALAISRATVVKSKSMLVKLRG